MTAYNIADLEEKQYFTEDVYLDRSFLLLNPVIPISAKLLNALKNWEFKTVLSDGKPTDSVREEPSSSLSRQGVIETIGDADDFDSTSEEGKLLMVQKVYNQYMGYINQVYTQFATHKKLSLEDLAQSMKELCEFIKENRRYVLRVQPSLEIKTQNFLVGHSMRSTVLAIVMGLYLHLPASKLIELAIACLVHEIGMLKLPPQLYMTDKPLSPIEKKSILTHPVLSYNILKEYEFPLNICLGVLEHHEKENGLGYPRKLASEKISLYAKIISVACSYEAVTAPRPHKKQAQNDFNGLLEILRNENKQYDETVIKALLYSLSLFPIGTYVILSDSRLAQVIDVDPENPKMPIVQIFAEMGADGNYAVVCTAKSTIKVVKPITKEEAKTILDTIPQGQPTAVQASSPAHQTPKAAPPVAKPVPSSPNIGMEEISLDEFEGEIELSGE